MANNTHSRPVGTKTANGALALCCMVATLALCFSPVPSLKSALKSIADIDVQVDVAHQPKYRIQELHKSAALIKPLLPRLSESIINNPDGKALAEFFEMQACPSESDGTTACILDLLAQSSSSKDLKERILRLRHLAKTIMEDKDIQCGNPKVSGKEIVGNTTEEIMFCFWENDYVSNEAMNSFNFEQADWQWVVRAFQDPHVQQHHKCLAFLDAGVNVGDWATPITGSLPMIAYFGIEGSPPTASIAAANMLTMILYQKYQEHVLDIAPRALVPFPVMSQNSLKQAGENGGVCFSQDSGNIGGQEIRGMGTLDCKARSTAGAAYFPDVLRNLFAQYQSSCRAVNSTSNQWPSVYIAKFDIQGFEFQTLAPAIAWLEEKPPCYIILEFCNKQRQNYALMELLVNVIGYDSVWISSIFQDNTVYDQPPLAPHWSKKDGTHLWGVYEKDMEGRVDWSYINYIFGFANQEACINRLLGRS